MDKRWRVGVGVDPSESSAGWCLLGLPGNEKKWQYLASGQCRGESVPSEVIDALPRGPLVRVVALGCEGIFPGVSRLPDGTARPIRPPHFWRLGFRSGLIVGELMAHEDFKKARLWTPEPNVWRAVLGMKQARREIIARRMVQWAEATSGFPMRGPRGGVQVDRAMAVGIASATVTSCFA